MTEYSEISTLAQDELLLLLNSKLFIVLTIAVFHAFFIKILLNRREAFFCVCLNFDRFGSFVRDSNIVKKLL